MKHEVKIHDLKLTMLAIIVIAIAAMGSPLLSILKQYVDYKTIEAWSHAASIFMVAFQVIALFFIYLQVSRQKRLSVAQFISSIMDQLARQKEFHRRLTRNQENSEATPDIDEADIVAFLNVFENIAAVVESGVIDICDIDQPFAYRFFLTVNNKTVQDIELIKDAKYYKSIYRLHRRWSEFRARKGLPQLGPKATWLDYRCEDYNDLSSS